MTYSRSDMKKCPNSSIIATNVTNHTELTEMLYLAYTNFSNKAFIIITEENIDIEYSIGLPVFYLIL